MGKKNGTERDKKDEDKSGRNKYIRKKRIKEGKGLKMEELPLPFYTFSYKNIKKEIQ